MSISNSLTSSSAIPSSLLSAQSSVDLNKLMPSALMGIIFSYFTFEELRSLIQESEKEFESRNIVLLGAKNQTQEKIKEFEDIYIIFQRITNKKQLQSVKNSRDLSNATSFDQVELVYLKEEIGLFLLMKDLPEETLAAIKTSSGEKNIRETFEKIFDRDEWEEELLYPINEIQTCIKLLIKNNEEEMAIELADKIPLDKRNQIFQFIVEALIEMEGNDKEKSAHYAKAIKLVSEKISDLNIKKWAFYNIAKALLKSEKDDKEKWDRYAKVVELADEISDLVLKNWFFRTIIEALLKREGNDQEKREWCDEARKWAHKILNPIQQSIAFQSIDEALLSSVKNLKVSK